MTAVALKGLLARKTRALLTALAIVLGVAMISGTYVLTDSVQKAFSGVFSSAFQETDVTITGREVVDGAESAPTVPAGLLEKVRALPEVEAAAGAFLFRDVKLIDRTGKTIGESQASKYGLGVDPSQPRFNPLELQAGTWAGGPGEIVVDAPTARDRGLKIGDTVGAKAAGEVRRYRITGLAEIRGVGLGGSTLAAFDVPTAQAVLDERGRFDAISVAAKDGVSDARLAEAIRPLVPASAQVRTAAQQRRADEAKGKEVTGIIQPLMLAFAGIALFVGAFVIFNTISITVAQRTRELATLRTLGASRRQVLASVVLESLALGVVASLIGLVAGVGLAKALNALLEAIGAQSPDGGTVFAARTVVVALVVGVAMTVVAGLLPALRATRVPPIAAVREGAVLPAARHGRLRSFAGAVLLLAGFALLAQGMFGGGGTTAVLQALGAGIVLVFLALAMVAGGMVRPLAAVAGWPSRHLGGSSGRLASGNAARNPARTASTAAALMIGLALVTFVATLGGGLKDSTKGAVERQVTADYVMTSDEDPQFGTFPAAAGDRLAAAPGVTVASSVRRDLARIHGKTEFVAGVDPATIAQVYDFAWRRGSDASLAGLRGGAIVDTNYAADHDLRIGSPVRLDTPTGESLRLTVKATYHPPQADPLFRGLVIAREDFDRAFAHAANGFTFARVQGGAAPATTRRLQAAIAAFPEADVATKAAWVTDRTGAIDQILALFYALLALSVVVSLFGMVNTLVLSVFERTREIGMLRAIGMTRRQVRRMIRHESVITALIGATLGLPLGVALAALGARALADEGVGFHLPTGSLVVFVLVAVVAGVLAAIAPARRAARLDVLHALQQQ
ncbi:MAG TPA: FtsX-like permease family protein [Solirubrobacteraceae bacterium]|jgi:putative ABC transport system permease protein